MNLHKFAQSTNLHATSLDFFVNDLNIKINAFDSKPITVSDFFKDEKKVATIAVQNIDKLFVIGLVDDDTLNNQQSQLQTVNDAKTISQDYPGLVLCAIQLKNTPTRAQLAELTRLVNRAFPYLPVTIIFKYDTKITFANAERVSFKQTWREGEKIGKVSLLCDININKTHSGHLRILELLSIEKIREYDRKNKVDTFNGLYKGWQNVFNTSILNEQFYKDYQQLSVKLINHISPNQEKDKLKAHQGALNLLNRMMFVYFIQKKKWLMNDQEFLFHFWQEYQSSNAIKDTFHQFWLNKVFFKAFNGKAFNDPEIFKTIPEKYHLEILKFPYLNGGLFTKTDCDDFILTDELFVSIFEFLQGYIFTISEDTAEEINLEISPELLGKMYEGMINATDLDDLEAENGIVYTERPEINFMTRRSFVEVLHKKLPATFSREFLYHFCFDKPSEKLELVKKYKVNVILLKEVILSITSLDPTCGSGSMLIGVIQLQVELIRTLDESIGNKHTPHDDFQLKKQIISECIYGVDIKEWAVRIAELRFWLYMIAEAEFTTEQLTKEPLLPNLDFKLRQGNSLLQEIGSKNFSLKTLFKGRKRNIGATKKLNDFIKKKKLFITNQSESETTYKQLKEEELKVFRDFINELKIENNQQITTIRKGDGQFALFNNSFNENKSIFENLILEIEKENEQLDHFLNVIKTTGRIPFSYDIDFMEIFVTKEDAGFDLIIGNPPYVRQEDILPADNALELERLLKDENKAEKAKVSKEYKEKLSAKVYEAFPFLSTKAKTVIDGKNKTINIYGDKVPGRSDLYVYFQLLMPTLLNSKGTFCFIISNSWLDVEYGSFVQHFLLKHTQLYAIYDCNVRSFAAKINTIIYFHSGIINANLTENQYKTFLPNGDKIKFIMNKADYTDTAYAPLLIEQEHCSENTFMTHYRLITKNPNELYLEAFDENEKSFIGDKWGGKWLNSPEIYFKIQKNNNVSRLKTLLSYSQRNNLEVF
jgi:Eco57I restriction-modification methylase